MKRELMIYSEPQYNHTLVISWGDFTFTSVETDIVGNKPFQNGLFLDGRGPKFVG